MNEKEAQNMNKNDINQTTSQENKNKSKNREEEDDKHKIYTGLATNCAYIQSPSNLWFLRFLSTW